LSAAFPIRTTAAGSVEPKRTKVSIMSSSTSRNTACAAAILDELGIVVIGRNEGRRLIDCLASINVARDRIVYADSGSTDGSPDAADRLGVSVVRLDAARPFTAARGRNEGFKALKRLRPGIRFVQFIDGDCELDKDWLSAALAFMTQRKDVAVVCGRRRERHPETSIYNRLCDFEWDTPVGESSACGGDSLMRTEAFEAVGGFRPQLIAHEEPELCLRLREGGWRIWRLSTEMTRHDAAIVHLHQWWSRTTRAGYGYAEVSHLHGKSQYGARREIARAVFWGCLAPLILGFGSVVHPAALLGALIYPLQICRIASLRGPTTADSWTYALFVVLAKFAEFQGIVKFLWRRWCGRAVELIEYKQTR
jgi:GT2 family glycosyltransferase